MSIGMGPTSAGLSGMGRLLRRWRGSARAADDSKVVVTVVRTTVTVQRGRRDLSWNDSDGPTWSLRAATPSRAWPSLPGAPAPPAGPGYPGKPGHPKHSGQSG